MSQVTGPTELGPETEVPTPPPGKALYVTVIVKTDSSKSQ